MIEQLGSVLRQPGTVIFLGSGISQWSGLPSWRGLISELSAFLRDCRIDSTAVDTELERGDLLQAASYAFDELTPPQFDEFMRRACRQGTARPVELHRLICMLGPSSFVTTNYDELLEAALRKWRSDECWRVVTNRNLAAAAEIVHARATTFVFKPHGDIHDPDSIILTREHYRKLLPHGELAPALESLKTILVSRPVVYLGFGLRDPDFLYLKDVLRNIYNGRTPDQYAVVPNALPQEITHWRRHYGVHLISYCANPDDAGELDHSELKGLLQKLNEGPQTVPRGESSSSAEQLLALARYGALVSRAPKKDPELKIRVTHRESGRRQQRHVWGRFDHSFVDSFLHRVTGRAVLIGMPGAGKTYAIKRAVAGLGLALQDGCLDNSGGTHVVPLFADLKLYDGNLWELVANSLPAQLSLTNLIDEKNCRIYLDSFNEVPVEYVESKAFTKDLSEFLTRVGDAPVVIASRTPDGLEDLRYPMYSLDEIDREIVERKLVELGISAGDSVGNEILALLQKPYYFQMVSTRAVDMPKGAHPKDLYLGLLSRLDEAFRKKFGAQLDMTATLQALAYQSIEDGHEAIPLQLVDRKLQAAIDAHGGALDGLGAAEVVDWLVGKEFLIPYTGERISFVHQSVTEFLAASELASRFRSNEAVLHGRLVSRRWDQALFLTLGYLKPEEAKKFLAVVLDADICLAVRAVRYMEHERDFLSSRVLEALLERGTSVADAWDIKHAVGDLLPISESHAELLRRMIGEGGLLREAAVPALARACGVDVVDDLLRLMFENRRDYNLCANSIGRALEPLITDGDLERIISLIDMVPEEEWEDGEERRVGGLISGICAALSGVDVELVERLMLSPSEGTLIAPREHVFCEFLWKDGSKAGLGIAARLLARGVNRAAVAIHFIAMNAETLDWSVFDAGHVDILVALVDDGMEEYWPVSVLRDICIARPDLVAYVETLIAGKSGIAKIVLLFATKGPHCEEIYTELERLVEGGGSALANERVGFLDSIDLNWRGRENLLIKIFDLRDSRLAKAILESFYLADGPELTSLDLLPMGPWVAWLEQEDDFFFRDRLASFITSQSGEEGRRAIISEFNKCPDERRSVLSILLHKLEGVTTDDLSKSGLQFLLDDFRSTPVQKWSGHILGSLATDEFVVERLLPMAGDKNEVVLRNLAIVLKAAGRRHGRRYELLVEKGVRLI